MEGKRILLLMMLAVATEREWTKADPRPSWAVRLREPWHAIFQYRKGRAALGNLLPHFSLLNESTNPPCRQMMNEAQSYLIGVQDYNHQLETSFSHSRPY